MKETGKPVLLAPQHSPSPALDSSHYGCPGSSLVLNPGQGVRSGITQKREAVIDSQAELPLSSAEWQKWLPSGQFSSPHSSLTPHCHG